MTHICFVPFPPEAQMLNKAIILATMAHSGQTDKQGEPYILHPLRVMLACQTRETRATAMLHDVVEDTSHTLDCLVSLGFPSEVVEAVDALTHRKGESYKEYCTRAKENAIARIVKIADIRDNYFNPARPCTGFRQEVIDLRRKGLELLEQP